jgi:hypothetical protein
MTLRSVRRQRPLPRLMPLVLLALLAVPLAGCGGASGTSSGTSTGQSMQVMATVKRGDIVETVMARLQVAVAKGAAKAVATVPAASAAKVAKGQAVDVTFGTVRAQGSPGAAPSGSPYPVPNGSAVPVPESSQGAIANGQGFGQGGFGGKAAKGIVASVARNDDGSAAVTIAIAKLPAGVTAKSVGFAQISAGTLAKNVLILPTVAIKGSGDNATVQVIVNGKTTERKVVVGKQSQMMSEIVSGLSEGDNVVYTRTFRGFPNPGQSGFPQGRPSGMPYGGQQGYPPGGTQSGTSGT